MSDRSPIAGQRKRSALVALALGVCVFAVYAPVRGFEFVTYDDPGYVSENALVRGGLGRVSIVWAFSTFTLANWHPLTWLSYLLDCSLFGPDPGALHLVSVAFHAINAALLVFALHAMTRTLWPSALVAALFALHPVNVESVAWIGERKNVLSLCVGLLALLAHLRFARRPGVVRQTAVAVLFALGLMAKPVLVTFPFLLLVLDFWPLRRIRTNASGPDDGAPGLFGARSPFALVREKAALILLAAASSVITVIAARAGGATEMISVPFVQRLGGATIGALAYAKMLLVPHDLAIVYPHPKAWPPAEILMTTLLLLCATAAAFIVRRRAPAVLAGWLWFLGTLVPTLGFVQVGLQWKADRYAYLPGIGLMMAIVFGIEAGTRGRRELRRVAAMAGMAAVAACAWETSRQLFHWRDSIALFRNATIVVANNGVAEYDLADAFVAKERWSEAIAHYREAARIHPGFGAAQNGLGFALSHVGDLDGALAAYRKSVDLAPDDPLFRRNYGGLLRYTNRFPEALEQFAVVARLAPNDADARRDFGELLQRLERFEEAVQELQRAVDLAPADSRARLALAESLQSLGRAAEARTQFAAVGSLDPDAATRITRRGLALIERGDTGRGIDRLRTALALAPDRVDALRALSFALSTAADPAHRDGVRALALAERAQALAGDDAETSRALATACAELGRFGAAIRHGDDAQRIANAQGRSELAAQLAVMNAAFAKHLPWRERR